MDARAQLVLWLLRVLVLASALRAAIEMLDLCGPDPAVPPHVLLDERLHSSENPSQGHRTPRGIGRFASWNWAPSQG